MRDFSPTGYWGTLKELGQVMKSAGVNGAAAVATIPLRAMADAALTGQADSESGESEANEEIREKMRGRLGRFNAWLCETCLNEGDLWPFVYADPFVGYKHLLNEVATRIETDGARGLKLHPMLGHYFPDDHSLWPLYEYAQKREVPLIFHGGKSMESPNVQYAHPNRFKEVLKDFPHLQIVVAHLGLDFWDDSVDLAGSFENVSFDTSMALSGHGSAPVLSDQEALELVRRIGCERVLFGTDFPWGSAVEDLDRIGRLGLSGEEKEAILCGNAKRVLGLIE
jgi:predicted TIM-barrel fold metal-dependent hydrolase